MPISKSISSMNQQEKFKKCLSEAHKLIKGEFHPEIDNLANKTVNDIMFKVVTEWDLATESEVKATRAQIRRAEKFMAKWKEHLEDKTEYKIYSQFNEE